MPGACGSQAYRGPRHHLMTLANRGRLAHSPGVACRAWPILPGELVGGEDAGRSRTLGSRVGGNPMSQGSQRDSECHGTGTVLSSSPTPTPSSFHNSPPSGRGMLGFMRSGDLPTDILLRNQAARLSLSHTFDLRFILPSPC